MPAVMAGVLDLPLPPCFLPLACWEGCGEWRRQAEEAGWAGLEQVASAESKLDFFGHLPKYLYLMKMT